jgi:cell division septal protein FtsQ
MNSVTDNEQQDLEFEAQRPQYGARVYVYLVMIALFLLSATIVKMKWQDHLPLSSVAVVGIDVLSKEEVVRLMKLPPRTTLYDIDLTEIQNNIAMNTFVKSVIVQRDPPSTVRITIEERVPAAMIVASEVLYIDDDGVVLPYIASSETYDIPVISGVDSAAALKAGMQVRNPDILEALQIIKTAKLTNEEMYHAISEIRLRKGHDMVLYSFEAGVPIIFGKGDIVNKIVRLDAFWQQHFHTIGAEQIRYIDVRFDDQVVVSRKAS